MGATLKYWADVRAKEAELKAEFVTNRRSKVAAGEADPHPLQPQDGSGIFLKSVAIPNDATSKAGRVICCNFELAARKLLGDNLYPSHVVANTEDIRQFWEQSEANHQSEMRMENAMNSRKVIHILPSPPRTKSA